MTAFEDTSEDFALIDRCNGDQMKIRLDGVHTIFDLKHAVEHAHGIPTALQMVFSLDHEADADELPDKLSLRQISSRFFVVLKDMEPKTTDKPQVDDEESDIGWDEIEHVSGEVGSTGCNFREPRETTYLCNKGTAPSNRQEVDSCEGYSNAAQRLSTNGSGTCSDTDGSDVDILWSDLEDDECDACDASDLNGTQKAACADMLLPF
jgi:hypothetical protein